MKFEFKRREIHLFITGLLVTAGFCFPSPTYSLRLLKSISIPLMIAAGYYCGKGSAYREMAEISKRWGPNEA